MKIPTRTIDEIRVRLTLEPTMREVFVEGPVDRDLYRWALGQLKLPQVKIYSIDTVFVDATIREKYGLTSGNRQRVIALARELAGAVSPTQALCIVDADLDYLLNREDVCVLLERTDGTSAELSVWNAPLLEKFFGIALGVENPGQAVIEMMGYTESIAADLFLLRAAIEDLRMEWVLIDIDGQIDRKNSFSFEDYCKKVANRNSGIKDLTEKVLPKVAELRQIADGLPKEKKVHGHELVSILRKKLINDKVDRSCLKDALDFGRALLALLEWSHVSQTKPFNSFERLRT